MNESILTFKLANSHNFSGGWPGQTSPFLFDVLYPFNNLINSFGLSPSPPNVSRIRLWEDYCMTSDSISYDCYSKCRNGGAFETMFDFSNCVTLSMLLNTGATGEYGLKMNYTVADPQNVSVVDVNNQPTGKYIITDDVDSLCYDTVASIWKCLSTKCESLPDCRWWLAHLRTDIYASKLRDEGSLFEILCHSVGYQLNSDIGGIGVYVSYSMQIGLALLLFVASVIMELISVYFNRWNASPEKQTSIGVRAQEQSSFLNKAMVDFHQSQCFFTIAINVAAMIVEKDDRTNSDSVQLLFSHCFFLTNIAISGYLPITFTLFNLYLVNKTYWYNVLISIASIVIAGAAQGTLRCRSITTRQNGRLSDIFRQGTLQECGFKNPWVYCDWAFSYLQDDPQVVGFRMIGFCAVVVAIVILSKFQIRGRLKSWIAHYLECDKTFAKESQERTNLPKLSNRYSGKAKMGRSGAKSTQFSDYETRPKNLLDRLRWQAGHIDWLELILRTCAICLYLAIVGIFCWYISIYISNLRSFATTRSLDPTWGFGQITALLVWAPSVSKYLLLVFRKSQPFLPTELSIKSDEITTGERKRDSKKLSQASHTFEQTQEPTSPEIEEYRSGHLPLPVPGTHPRVR